MCYSFLQNYNFSAYTKTSIIAPTQIGHEHYTYDANGNPTLVENDSLGTEQGNRNSKDDFGKRRNANGSYRITESTITVFEGTLIADANRDDAKHKGLTLEQAISGVAGHELVHATDAKEINRDIRHEIKNRTPRNDREVLPNKVEQEIIEESKTLNKQ